MKKITFLGALLLSGAALSLNAVEIKVTINDNLSTIIRNAADGDVVTLTEAAVYKLDTVEVGSITIQADPTLKAKPVIQLGYTGPKAAGNQFIPKNGAVLNLDGIVFDAVEPAKQSFVFWCQEQDLATISVNNCDFINMGNWLATRRRLSTMTIMKTGSLTVTNSTFRGIGQLITSPSTIAASQQAFADITFLNCYISVKGTSFYGAGTSATPDIMPDNLTVKHVTFNGCGAREFNISTNVSTSISDVILANNAATANLILGAYGNFFDKCALWNYSPGKGKYVDVTKLVGNGLVDPKFDANGISTAPEFVNAGSDGNTIGYYKANDFQMLPSGIRSVSANVFGVHQNGNQLIVKGAKDNADFQVMTLSGQKVLAGKVNNNTIGINALAKGVYLVKVNSAVAKVIVR